MEVHTNIMNQEFTKTVFNIIILGQLAMPLSSVAADDSLFDKILAKYESVAKDKVAGTNDDLFTKKLNKDNDTLTMKWVKGDFRAVSSDSTTDAVLNIKAFTVLKEYEKQVYFTQYGVSTDMDNSTLNVGLGFYHLTPVNFVVGGNIFYDAKTGSKSILNPFGDGVHKRYSVGGTLMSARAGVFFNIYKGISDSIEGYKVSDGYDFGFNTVVPGYENIGLGISKYDFNEDNNGSQIKVEYKPNSFFTFGVKQDQSDSPSTSLYVETKYKFNTSFEEQLAPITNAASNVWDKRYNEVERENTIILESDAIAIVTSPATLGVSEYNVRIDAAAADGSKIVAFSTLSLNVLKDEIPAYDTNKQNYTIASTDFTLNGGDTAWTDRNAVLTELVKAENSESNCYFVQVEDSTEDALNPLAYDIFVRKGTECNVNVTFAINDSSDEVTVEKTESIRFYAEK